jgi:hypothetical protein
MNNSPTHLRAVFNKMMTYLEGVDVACIDSILLKRSPLPCRSECNEEPLELMRRKHHDGISLIPVMVAQER